MAHLRERGVVFADYDFPGLHTENGIATDDMAHSAWFQDSEGNYLCLDPGVLSRRSAPERGRPAQRASRARRYCGGQ